MPLSVSAGPSSDAWTDLVEATRHRVSERKLLRGLVEILAEELGASVARIALNDSEGQGTKFAVRLGRDSGASARTLTVQVSGAQVSFEGIAAGTDPSLDGLRLTALGAAIRAFEQSEDAKRHRFEVNYRGVALDALYDVGLAIAATLNLDELSEEILLRAVSLLDARRGAFYRKKADEFVLDRTFGGDAVERVSPSELEGFLAGQTRPEASLLPGSEHLLAVPIRVEAGVRGLLVVGDKESRDGVGPFASPDRRTLELFANQAAIALENAYLHKQALEKERLEREGELAAGIQKRLLPEVTPEIDGFELTGWSRSARMVGGDYYNYIRLEEGIYFVVLADVTGKGMPAALLVSTLDSALRLLLEQGFRGAELMSALNAHILATSASNTFITLVAAEIDSVRGRCRYTSAGHNPSLWLPAGATPRRLGATGLPLGLFAGSTYAFESLELERGDLVCLYSDGITECLSPDEEEFGIDRLVDLLARSRDQPLAKTASSICDQMTAYAASGARGDDQTIVLLRRR